VRIRAVMAGAGVVAGLVGFTGSPALASGITVDPERASRGKEVTITGFGCRGGGYEGPDTGVSISGRAIRTVQDSVTNGRFSTTTKVRWDAPLGRSTITAVCQMSGQKLTGTIIVGFERHDGRFPRRFPRTGGGGMAASMAADEGGAPILGGLGTAAGLGLLAGAIGIGGVTLVRSRRARSRGES